MPPVSSDSDSTVPTTRATFRRAVLRGLGVVLPPLLTLVLFIWAWNLIENYVLLPVESGIRHAVVWTIRDIRPTLPPDAVAVGESDLAAGFTYNGVDYILDPAGRRFLPRHVVQYVNQNLDRLGPYQPSPLTASAYWHRYVELRYLPRTIVVPVFLIVFLAVLYFLGRLFTHGLGRWVITTFDRFVSRLPLISNVYGSVKQVTDFVFSDRQIEFNRVVAVEYPRKGMWSLGFVTGQSMVDISAAANEPVLSVLMPTSPMPMTGFTITVRKSEAIDMNLTIDQAIQFIVSCGVVVPPNQQQNAPRLPLDLPPRNVPAASPAIDVRDTTAWPAEDRPERRHERPHEGPHEGAE